MSEWMLVVNGTPIVKGEKLLDFRGDALYFAGIAQPPSPGKSGKCFFAHTKAALRKGEFSWDVYYPGVVSGEIVNTATDNGHGPKRDHFIALGQNVWGKAQTIAQAVKNARKQSRYAGSRFLVYSCSQEAVVTGMGMVQWDEGSPAPRKVGLFNSRGNAVASGK